MIPSSAPCLESLSGTLRGWPRWPFSPGTDLPLGWMPLGCMLTSPPSPFNILLWWWGLFRGLIWWGGAGFCVTTLPMARHLHLFWCLLEQLLIKTYLPIMCLTGVKQESSRKYQELNCQGLKAWGARTLLLLRNCCLFFRRMSSTLLTPECALVWCRI